MALDVFRSGRGIDADPAFVAWLERSRPLTGLASLRAILDLDRRNEPGPTIAPKAPQSPAAEDPAAGSDPTSNAAAATTVKTPEPPPPAPRVDRILIGTTNDRQGEPVAIDPAELTRHAAFLGARQRQDDGRAGGGRTAISPGNPGDPDRPQGRPVRLRPARHGTAPGLDGELAARAEKLRSTVEVALYTPRRPDGRPLSIAAVPAGLGALPSHEREQAARFAATALADMMNYGDGKGDQSCLAILTRAIDLLGREPIPKAIAIGDLIGFLAEKDPALINEIGYLDVKLIDRLVQDLETLRLNRGDLLAAEGEPLDVDALFGKGPSSTSGKTRLSVISTKFLGNNENAQFWVSQLLMALARWISKSPAPDGTLQAVVLFDEADLYLPAVRQPATKEPMEHLLKRARSAGLGLLLATQSPGDFDYKCRDNIRAWLVGQVKEANSIAKMKPMLSDCRIDVASRLPSQEPGEFCFIRDGEVTLVKTLLSAVDPRQIPEEEIVRLARRAHGF